ncbi:hypothetical protein AQUCO_01400095v1 [Aquilegia coerulea]|uniref:PB1 domain-containing protein n=1 Tax=Aquilegia coerulea TaxID=218851 RepID=A0A2G5DUG4_AQUCA|nr:hypothetical protein AQUCO_01400095v1 [Aquilegia coerulea]PIA47164.1 hypothetical protein AQUCO_01400095v1 [Aquilegia coerulea]
MAAEGGGNEETSLSPKNRIKFLCSHGGKILPRPPDGQLKYVGGETRVVAVPRDIIFSELMKKLSSLSDGDFVLKYQVLPEDLDTLISVTCDEDLQNMFAEYDRQEKKSSMSENSGCPMLRSFLFPPTQINVDNQLNPETMDNHALEQHYIDAINGLLRTPITFRRRANSFKVSSTGSSPKSMYHDNYAFDTTNHELNLPNGYHLRNKDIPRVNSSPSLYNLGHHTHYYHPAHQQSYHTSSGFHVQCSSGNGQQLAPVLSVDRNDFVRYQMGYPHRPPRYHSPATPTTPRREISGCNGCGHGDECRVYRSGGVDMVVSLPHGSMGA